MRSLILAGGGIKVGYQAGVLQVLLDEAGLEFDHIDAASGGCFNAAMLANGMTGTQVADAWRTMDPNALTTLNIGEYYKLIWARSIGTPDGLINTFRNIWHLDFDTIRRAHDRVYTFNHFNFSDKNVVTVEQSGMDEQLLIACVTLIMWMPPVEVNQQFLFDACYCTNGNVSEAVRRGADDIWAIWTVSDTGEYRDGFLAQYFHLIETVANARFKEEWREIAAVNAAIATFGPDASRPEADLRLRLGFVADPGMRPPPGRKTITQHLIQQEVPVHYVLNTSRDRMAAAVEMGVRDARAYLTSIGIAYNARPPSPPSTSPPPPAPPPSPVGLSFRETMRGHFMPGETDPRKGEYSGRRNGNDIAVRLELKTDDLDEFLRRPPHEMRASGTLDCPFLSGTLVPLAGSFHLFVNETDDGRTVPGHKKMQYDLTFTIDAQTYRFHGEKIIEDTPGHALWPDTTTLLTQITSVGSGGRPDIPYGAGVLHVLPLDFLGELTTFDVEGALVPTARAAALARFGRFFLGQAWDVYARQLVDYAPF